MQLSPRDVNTPATLFRRSRLTPLCGLYAIALASWFSLAVATGDRLWWVAFLSDLALALLLPLPVLLLLTLWRRRWAALAVLVIPILISLWLFGAQFLPGRAHTPQPGEHSIGAMTLNVLYTNRDFAAVASVIRTANPDVVGLQEVTPKIIAGLVTELANEYPYHAAALPPTGSGVLLLSRHPITTSAPFALPPRQAALHAEVQMQGGPLHVLVAHLVPSRKFSGPLIDQPAAQRAFVTTRAIEEPLLLLCDCNMSDTSPAHARMRTFLRDSFGEVGWGLGLTQLQAGWLPVQRIDYVWFAGNLVPLSAETRTAPGADHRLVLAQFVQR